MLIGLTATSLVKPKIAYLDVVYTGSNGKKDIAKQRAEQIKNH